LFELLKEGIKNSRFYESNRELAISNLADRCVAADPARKKSTPAERVLLLGLARSQVFADFQTPFVTLLRMRAIVQRVARCRVVVEGNVVGEIGPGLLVLLGVSRNDDEPAADYLAEKIIGLRIFEDAEGKMNLSVRDTRGAVLVVSQFTLYGDVRRGKRPSFDAAARPEEAKRLYEYFVGRMRAAGLRCETGQFQAMMEVELVNSGPVTIMLDSERIF
jgi:D-tyrosyl-tRNA(Tyr) deacylase